MSRSDLAATGYMQDTVGSGGRIEGKGGLGVGWCAPDKYLWQVICILRRPLYNVQCTAQLQYHNQLVSTDPASNTHIASATTGVPSYFLEFLFTVHCVAIIGY